MPGRNITYYHLNESTRDKISKLPLDEMFNEISRFAIAGDARVSKASLKNMNDCKVNYMIKRVATDDIDLGSDPILRIFLEQVYFKMTAGPDVLQNYLTGVYSGDRALKLLDKLIENYHRLDSKSQYYFLYYFTGGIETRQFMREISELSELITLNEQLASIKQVVGNNLFWYESNPKMKKLPGVLIDLQKLLKKFDPDTENPLLTHTVYMQVKATVSLGLKIHSNNNISSTFKSPKLPENVKEFLKKINSNETICDKDYFVAKANRKANIHLHGQAEDNNQLLEDNTFSL